MYVLILYRVTPTCGKNRSKRKKTVMGRFSKGVARVAMEDEAQWMTNSNLTSEKTIPDLVNYIYPDGLKVVKPEAVKLFVNANAEFGVSNAESC